MKKEAILSALGRDRVGVADDLTGILSERRIEIQDSRMMALGGRFALIMQVTGKAEDITNLKRELPLLGGRLGFDLLLEPREPAAPAARGTHCVIESYSRGPAGVAAVTGVLKRHGINVDEFKTDAVPAPFTMSLTFHMMARITVPEALPISRLEDALRELERDDRNLDILLRPWPTLVSEVEPA